MRKNMQTIPLELKDSKQLPGKLHGFGMPYREKYQLLDSDLKLNVIRDDLPFKFPSPNFSKIRGLVAYFEKLQEAGVKTVASQDTIIGRIGWGVGYFAEQFDMKHYSFYPTGHRDFYRKMTESFGSTIVPLPGNHQRIVEGWAKKWLEKEGVNNYHYLPTGLRLDESKEEHMQLVRAVSDSLDTGGTLLLCISSGTILSGILAAIIEDDIHTDVIGVTVADFKNRYSKIMEEAKRFMKRDPRWEFGFKTHWNFEVNWSGYTYAQAAKIKPPFPCDAFLDRKAFDWMMMNWDKLKKPVTFWNIGGEWSPEAGMEAGQLGDGVASYDTIMKHLKDKGVE